MVFLYLVFFLNFQEDLPLAWKAFNRGTKLLLRVSLKVGIIYP
jgi:hypothetical protein